MRYFKTNDENIEHIIISGFLFAKVWLIGCSATNPDDPKTCVMETVMKYHLDGPMVKQFNGNPVFVEYGISPAKEGSYPYRLHDSLAMPILSGLDVTNLAKSIKETYDVLLLDENYFDKNLIYGKLGTDHEDDLLLSELV